MERIIKLFMDRDDVTYDVAREMYYDCKSELYDAIEGTSVLTPEEVLYGYGLEMDYVFEFTE